jgi:prepilin-type processing-associated H-X9-DG protein
MAPNSNQLRRHRLPPRVGLTLVEALVVLGILGLLIALTIPAVQRARDAAARAHCASNLRQLALAVHHFADARRKLPEGCGYPSLKSPRDLTRQAGISWQTAILPFVEQGALWEIAWEAQRVDPRGNQSPLHAQVREQILAGLLCPTETTPSGHYAGTTWSWGVTTYLGVAGSNRFRDDGVFHRNLTVPFAGITDGASNTLLIGERPAGPDGDYSGWYAGWGASSVCLLAQLMDAGEGRWVPRLTSCQVSLSTFRPGRLGEMCDVNHFWSLHSGGGNFAFADGSVRFVTYSSSTLLPALATRAGGEVVSLD